MENTKECSGGSRQNVDRVLSQKNLANNEICVHFHSNLEILTGFQKPCDPVWIRHWSVCKICITNSLLPLDKSIHYCMIVKDNGKAQVTRRNKETNKYFLH